MTSPGEATELNLDDALELLESYEDWAADFPPGEVTAVGALAISLALREVAQAIWRSQPL